MDEGQSGGADAVKKGLMKAAMRRAGDSSTELHCTTVGAAGGDRLWFRPAAGRMPAGFGQTQPVVIPEPSQ